MTKNDENPISDDEQQEPGMETTSKQPDAKAKINTPLKKGHLYRIGLSILAFCVMVLTVWGGGSLIVNAFFNSPSPTPTKTALPTPAEAFATPIFNAEDAAAGVIRFPEIQTTYVPVVKERFEVETYTVENGDTIFGIAEKFGLKAETILWGNRYILGDTPDGLNVGIELNILPVDGVYHRWSEGEGLNGVASFYGVDPEDIVNYPGNGLDPDTVGSFANPNIEPGTMLVVPDGTRPTVAWVVARDNPASGASYLGPGACSGIIYGDVGTGTFTWPTTATWLSGYDYNPPVHNGLDFDGDFGSPIFAADSGVIVYSGWSDRGYGNLIVVDHDRGWQTFYAHLMDGTLLPCGSNVQKGDLIASMGSTGNSTGPHLHFEMRLEGQPVNPWQFLQ